MEADTQGMSPAEIELMKEFGEDGMPAEDALEAENKRVLALNTDGTSDDEGDGADPVDAAAAPPPAAPAPAAATPPAAPTPAAATPAVVGDAPAQPAAEPAVAASPPAAEIQPAPPPFVAQFKAEVPADAAEQIKALTTEERAAYKKLMEGEIDFDAYDEVRARTGAAAEDLRTKALKAVIFEEMNEQAQLHAAEADWRRAEDAQFTAFKGEGLDYRAKPALLAAFNHNLKTLGGDKANDNRDAAWFLTEAHRITKDDLGIKPVAATPAAPAAPAVPTPPAKPRVDLSQIPPTLGRVPPAADATISGDEFAHLANLKGGDLEREYARMTPEQQERYLN